MNPTNVLRRLGHAVKRSIEKRLPSRVRPKKPWLWDDSVSRYQPDNFKIYWETLEEVSRYQSDSMTGVPGKELIDYLTEYLRDHVGSRDLRALFVGCSELGRHEVSLFKTGMFKEVVVMDLAEGLLRRQQAKADQECLPIRYVVQDFNALQLPSNAYDFIFALGTVHHVERLEAFFVQINASLTQRGIFAMREFVGPDRLQWTDQQLALVNALSTLIPEPYRRRQDGRLKEEERRPKLRDMIEADPSEAVRSSAVLPVLRQHLEVVRHADTGGTMLQLLLNGIAGNFEKGTQGRELLQTLIGIDRLLVEGGLLPSDYMFCLAKKR